MKYLLILFLLIPALSFGQLCETFDTVRITTSSMVTSSTARINGSVSHIAPSQIVSLLLKYVRTGLTDTVTSSGLTPLRNISGLSAGTAYSYYFTTVCPSGTVNQLGIYTFTTLSNAVVFATERSTVFPYVKTDSGFRMPRGDTSLYRATAATGGNIIFKTSDSLPYYYNGQEWKVLAVDSSGILPALNLKVDSVTVDSDTLFYWVNGTAYGEILPAAINVSDSAWSLTGNSGTVAGTNFLGTTDAVGLMFKTDNIQSGYIDIVNGNTSLGESSLLSNVDGQYNVAIGINALQNNVSGNNNLAIGGNSLLNNTASENVAVGNGVLTANTTGSSNVGIGNSTLSSSIIADQNTAIGDRALSITTNTGNTALGSQALTGTTTGGANIALGLYAGAYNTTLSNRLFINSQSRANILGDTTKSIIYGAQDATAANQRLYLNSRVFTPYLSNTVTGNVLYYNSTTGEHTYGTASTGTVTGSGTTNYIPKWSSSTALGNSVMYDDGTNIGIGTTSPTRLLQVGTIDPVISLKQDITAQEYSMRVGVGTGIASQLWNVYNNTASKYLISGGTNRVIIGNPTSPYAASTLFVQGYGSSGSNIDAQPDSTIYDEGNIEIMKSDYSLGGGIAMRGWGNVGIAGTAMGYTKKNMGLLDFTNNTNLIRTSNNTSLRFGTYDIERMVLDSNGRLGIGLAAPTSVLDVLSTATTGTGFNLASSTLTSGALATFTNTGTAAASNTKKVLSIVSSGANATASQTVTGQTISVNNTGTTNSNVGLNTKATGGTTDNYAIQVRGFSNEGIFRTRSVASGTTNGLYVGDWTGAGYASTIFLLRPSGATTATTIAQGSANLTITNVEGTINLMPATNVGIGTTSPTTKLHVAGRAASTQGVDVASTAGVMTLGSDGNSFEITGTNTITAINNTNWINGSEVILLFTSTAVLTDGTANSGTSIGMELAGNVNFTASAGATIKLVLSEIGGTQAWREVSRSVN